MTESESEHIHVTARDRTCNSPLIQLDGNISVSSEKEETVQDEEGRKIETIFGIKRKKEERERREPTIKVIKRTNKLAIASQLPSVLNINPRSVFNKQDKLKEMIKVLNIDVCTKGENA